jgi:hypothetical protein
MKKFMVLYHAPIDARKQMTNTSPEEQARGMEAWMEWAQKCGPKLVDLGTPLGNGNQLSPDGNATPSEKGIAGFSILQADNMDEAIALLQGHPHLKWNADCTIEVYESMPLPV